MGLFKFNGNERLTLDQVKNHPWMNKAGFDFEGTRRRLMTELAQKTGKTVTPSASAASFASEIP